MSEGLVGLEHAAVPSDLHRDGVAVVEFDGDPGPDARRWTASAVTLAMDRA